MWVVEVLSSGERPSWRRVGDGSDLEGAPSVVEAVGVGEVSVATRRLMCRPGGGGGGVQLSSREGQGAAAGIMRWEGQSFGILHVQRCTRMPDARLNMCD